MNTPRTDQAILACGSNAVPSSFEKFARDLEVELTCFKDESMRQHKIRLAAEEQIEILRKHIKILATDSIKWTPHQEQRKKNGKNGRGCG